MTTCNACEKQKIQTLSADDLVTLSLVQLRKLEYRSKHPCTNPIRKFKPFLSANLYL